MGITWAVISWTVPSYIPVSYPIITYEIGYHVLDNCSYVDINTQLTILSNISNVSTSINITDLRANTCYLFGVRAYTINGYGLWTVTTNRTLLVTITDSKSGKTYIIILHFMCVASTFHSTTVIGLTTVFSIVAIGLIISNVLLILYIVKYIKFLIDLYFCNLDLKKK